MMTTGKGEPFGKTAKSLAAELAGIWLGDEPSEMETFAMRWGIENEPLARMEYERLNFCTVPKPDFQIAPDLPFIGGTADGLVGTSGLVEIKCPTTANHRKNILFGEQVLEYMYQMHGYMWIYQREWCDFVSFDPRSTKQIHVIRVNRDDAIIRQLRERAVLFRELVQSYYDLMK